MMQAALIVTCEHGGHRLPGEWRTMGVGHEALLASHRGWDPGALELAHTLAAATHAPLHYATVSRLLVELNRSPGHPALFSELSRPLDGARRERVLERHYRPYRAAVEDALRATIRDCGSVVHVSAHTFTPVLDGRPRRVDVGLLYDPARQREKAFCETWQATLRRLAPTLSVRRNAPYRGVADGFTTWLRRRLPAHRYVGLELEVNQRHALGPPDAWRRLRALLADTLTATLADRDGSGSAHDRRRALRQTAVDPGTNEPDETPRAVDRPG